MNCLCCGKPITVRASEAEVKAGWHRTCVRRFFGTAALPELNLSDENLTRIALESTQKGFTVPGVQKKMSLHLEFGSSPRLTLVNYPTGYILKPPVDHYPALPEAEFLVMQMARATGIGTVPFAMIQLEDGDTKAYITRRVDRVLPSARKGTLQLLAMEDFCQLDRRLTADKYRGSYERCAKVITRYSAQPGLDLTELFLRLVFSFVTGNSDMHLKNFSLIETVAGSGTYKLSDAYDLVPTNLILPEDPEQFAITMNGKKRGIRRNDFLHYADNIGLSKKTAENMITAVLKKEEVYYAFIQDSYLPETMKESYLQLVHERLQLLLPGNHNERRQGQFDQPLSR